MKSYLAKSKLFDIMMNIQKENIAVIKKSFYSQFDAYGFKNKNEVEYFINNYKMLNYKKKNILKYLRLVVFFDYDIKEDFGKYLFETYFYNKINIDISCDDIYMINSMIRFFNFDVNEYYHKINNYGLINKKSLYNFSQIMRIKELILFEKSDVTDDDIKNLIDLEELNLSCNKKITDDGIKNLVNIVSLDLTFNNLITDEGLKNKKLISLTLTENKMITDDFIKNIQNLRYLYLYYNKCISQETIKLLESKGCIIASEFK